MKKLIESIDHLNGSTLNESLDVFVIHPSKDGVTIQITDVQDPQDFCEEWENLPDRLQEEFGWDTPLWQSKLCGRMSRTKIPMKFMEYVGLVQNHINNSASLEEQLREALIQISKNKDITK